MGTCMSTDPGVANGVEKRSMVGRKQRKKESEKQVMEALTNEGRRDVLLALTPGRMFRIGASESACLFTQQGRKGTNQDAMLVWENFASMEDAVFCGVFDGHGPFGHLVARRVRDSLPSKLLDFWHDYMAALKEINGSDGEQPGIGDSRRTDYGSNVSTVYDTAYESAVSESAVSDVEEFSRELAREPPVREPPSMFSPWKESHLMAFKEMDQDLRTHPGIDTYCSGTTTVTVLKQGQHLVIGNVGDSRAIMGTRDENGRWKAVQLTVDLKPNLPHEAQRIRECRGRVFALHDEPEVMRVWLPFDNSPGLAMARAFGDFCLKDYGVIAVPEVTYRQVTDRDKFIILATDGIWDVLSNEEAVQIIATAPTRATAARSLVESAVRVWRLKYPTSKVDDCAVVCLFLDRGTDEDTSTATSSELNYNENPPSSALTRPPIRPGVTFDDASQGIMVQETEEITLSGPKAPEDDSHEVGEIVDFKAGKKVDHSESKRRRSLADWLDADESEHWNALEGITRVNSLLNLPRHSLAALDGEEFLAMEGDIGGGLILARDILVAKDSPDKMNITSRIEARSVGAGSGGFSRLVRLRIRPLMRLDHPLKSLVRYTAIDGKEHVLRGDEGFGETTISGSDRPNGEWTLVDTETGLAVTNRFDLNQVELCVVNWCPASVTFELWSEERPVSKETPIVVSHEYEFHNDNTSKL